MTPAHQALWHAGARLTDNQRQVLDGVLKGIEAEIRSGMSYVGIAYETSCTDMAIAQAVVNEARRAGWTCETKAKLQRGLDGTPRTVGLVFILKPVPEAYDEAHRELAEDPRLGVVQ